MSHTCYGQSTKKTTIGIMGRLQDHLKTVLGKIPWLYRILLTVRRGQVFREYERAYGDWRYPFLLVAWKMSALLVPRRSVKIDGMQFSLSCENWITHFRWYLFEKKEPEVRYFIDTYISDGDVFFDIGANVGVFSIYAGKSNPGLRVHCFEPEISNAALLKVNIIENGLADQVLIHSFGFSDQSGLSNLWLYDLTAGAALHTESKGWRHYTVEGRSPVVWREEIYSTTLDDYCECRSLFPDWIKIDTDGNERKILEGARKLLQNTVLKGLIIEMPSEKEDSEKCRDTLAANGFRKRSYPYEKSRNEIWVRA